MDYADKLPPSPWYIFAPPPRYIFPPPLTDDFQTRLRQVFDIVLLVNGASFPQ